MKVTKRLKRTIMLSLLCLLVVLGFSVKNSMTAMAAEADTISVSDGDEEVTTVGTSEYDEELMLQRDVTGGDAEAEKKMLTINFYDSDGKTLLLSIHTEYVKGGVILNTIHPNYGDINITRKGYSIEKWHNQNNNQKRTPSYVFNEAKITKDTDYVAVWSKEPTEFAISYHLNGGTVKPNASGGAVQLQETFTVESGKIVLPALQRKNYIFSGWYKDAAFKQKLTAIPAGTYFDSDSNGDVASYHVYAKWTSAKPKQMSKPTAKNNATGKIKVSFKSMKSISGYQMIYSTDKNFKKNTFTRDLKKKTSVTLTNLVKGTTYYFKVRAYKKDSTGNLVYGKYSAVRSCKVTKGVKEYEAKSNSGKLTKVSIKNGSDLYVTATVSKRLKSSDHYYYLVKVDPNTGKVLKQIAKAEKTTKVTFQLPVKDEKGNNHIQGKFGVAVKKGSKYMLITSTSYIANPEAAADYTAAFPTPASKKGRQGLYSRTMGDKNYFWNFYLNSMIGTKKKHDVAYKYNGKTYYFNEPELGEVAKANEDGGTVTVQVMLQWDSKCKDLILPSGRKQGAYYYAFNTEEKAAREKIEAAFHYLAEYASKENYHVDNWILGNEVNTFKNPNVKWYYAGDISRDEFMENYASTFRMLYYAVKSNYKNARVYICTDHTWIDRDEDWGARYFMEAFDKEIAGQNKNIKWNLAYHAYSAVLTNADFWNDGSLAVDSEYTDFVSPKNLEILTNYVRSEFGRDVRIILSEQGFSASGGVGSPYNQGRQAGEEVQAAAIAWLYYKAQFNDMIDAVIFSAGDHGGAGYQFDVMGREAEDVYKYMDTPKYATYTNKCLSVIGEASWKSAVNGFDEKILKKMPKR